MPKKNSSHKNPFFNAQAMLLCCIALSALLLVPIAFYNLVIFFIALPLVLTFDILCMVVMSQSKRKQRVFLKTLADELGQENRDLLYRFPIPVAVCQKDGHILWYNDFFHEQVAQKEPLTGENFSVISGENLEDFCNRSGVQISYKDRFYHVHAIFSPDTNSYLFYFEENTSLIQTAQEYKLSKPAVVLFMIDNYEEIFEGLKESAKSAIVGKVDSYIEEYINQTTGFLKRLSKERFLAVIEQRHLDMMIKERFPILDQVRSIHKEESASPVTLSIGVGFDAPTLNENEAIAHQALDMALGRGGDQAAVRTSGGFQFYGGVSKGIEKRTKVKSRIIATALREFIDQSDKVILMGHRFGDLDCVGASIGLSRAITLLDKPAYIAIDRRKNLASMLLKSLEEEGYGNMIKSPSEALDMVTRKTLLIILDTHNPDFLESERLYEKCENVIVIDHHRKMVRYIERSLIFYHEPFASSASEMVTELIQYLGDIKLGALEANSLMAGIMLDSKNFVIKTGVRTFEAAAYLKGLGADTIAVRRLFSDTIDTYQKKSRIVSGAETYRNCAIAISDIQSEDLRTIAPQSADELLGISDVLASFVIYMMDDTANITARSLGDVNVQVIMENLGGGGHQTMAACQIPDSDIERVRQMLLESIDSYLNEIEAKKKQKETEEKPEKTE